MDSENEIVGAARAFAIAAHGDQKYGRGEGARPYVAHLDEVAAVLRQLGASFGLKRTGGASSMVGGISFTLCPNLAVSRAQ